MISLSDTQAKVLFRMRLNRWYSAYDLDCSLSTLRALSHKGYLEQRSELGSAFFPRNNILFKKAAKNLLKERK